MVIYYIICSSFRSFSFSGHANIGGFNVLVHVSHLIIR